MIDQRSRITDVPELTQQLREDVEQRLGVGFENGPIDTPGALAKEQDPLTVAGIEHRAERIGHTRRTA